jgi:hypothetical protein
MRRRRTERKRERERERRRATCRNCQKNRRSLTKIIFTTTFWLSPYNRMGSGKLSRSLSLPAAGGHRRCGATAPESTPARCRSNRWKMCGTSGALGCCVVQRRIVTFCRADHCVYSRLPPNLQSDTSPSTSHHPNSKPLCFQTQPPPPPHTMPPASCPSLQTQVPEHELFETVDLWEEKDMTVVVNCMCASSLSPPPHLPFLSPPPPPPLPLSPPSLLSLTPHPLPLFLPPLPAFLTLNSPTTPPPPSPRPCPPSASLSAAPSLLPLPPASEALTSATPLPQHKYQISLLPISTLPPPLAKRPRRPPRPHRAPLRPPQTYHQQLQ